MAGSAARRRSAARVLAVAADRVRRCGDRRGAVKELTTGLLVTVSAVPLAIGLAAVAGVPPIVGLYTCVWPLVAFAILGSSPHLKLGMDASSAALIAATVPALVAAGDPDAYVAAAAALTALTGVIVLVAGVLRAGVLADLLSLPVLIGYTAGIATTVVISQLPRLLGVPVSGSDSVEILRDVVGELDDVHGVTLATGLLALAAVRVLRRVRPGWPAAAIVLVAGIVLSALLDLQGRGVAVVGALPSGLPLPALPDVSWSQLGELLGPAFAVALVVAADSVITSRSFAVRLGYHVDADRDLVGVGAANLASAVTGGVVASASYARTAIAEENGSRSQASGVAAAGAMAVVLVALPGVLADTPVALLAAIVVDAVLRLIDPPGLVRIVRVRPAEGIVALVTFAAVLVLGLLPAIALAVGVTVALAAADLGRAWKRHVEAPAHPRFGRLDVVPSPPVGGATLTWHGPLIFLNAGRFRQGVLDALREVEGVVVFDARDVTTVDVSGAHALAELEDELAARRIVLRLEGMDDVSIARVRRAHALGSV